MTILENPVSIDNHKGIDLMHKFSDVEKDINQLKTTTELQKLKKEQLNGDPKDKVERKPDYKGKKVFDYYDKKGIKREIVIGKVGGNSYSVRVKKWVKLANGTMGWQTQKNGKEDFYSITASDLGTFNTGLGEILNKNIGAANRSLLTDVGKRVYESLQTQKTDLKKKPIKLQYNELNAEKQPHAKLCDRESVEGRVQRCLRWTSITDAVEDRYGIPRGLLLAMAAQESYGDPTVTNNGGDGGAGLLHIQPKYAKLYGLKIETTTTSGAVDKGHGEKLVQRKTETKNDLKKLCNYDDRFNIVLTTDVSARFLIGEYKNINKTIPERNNFEGRLKVASWYYSPSKTQNNRPTLYGKRILYYWSVMNQIRGIKKPSGFKNSDLKGISEGTKEFNINSDGDKNNKHTVVEDVKRTQEAIKNMDTDIDNKPVSVDDYYKYWADQCDNYGLQEYIKYNKEHPYIK